MNRNLKSWLAAVAVFGALAAWSGAVEMQKIESSWLDEAGYYSETKTLTIRMKYSSDVYEYEGVPEEVYKAFLEAESKGGFFATEIQYKYPTVRH